MILIGLTTGDVQLAYLVKMVDARQVSSLYMPIFLFHNFSRFYIFIFRDRGKEGERDREKY